MLASLASFALGCTFTRLRRLRRRDVEMPDYSRPFCSPVLQPPKSIPAAPAAHVPEPLNAKPCQLPLL